MLKTIIGIFSNLTSRDRVVLGGLTGARIVSQALDILGLALVGVLTTGFATLMSGDSSLTLLNGLIVVRESSDLVILTVIAASLFVSKSLLSAVLLRLTTNHLATLETRVAGEVFLSIFVDNSEKYREVADSERIWAVGRSTQVAFSLIVFSTMNLIAESALFIGILITFLAVNWLAAIVLLIYLGVIIFGFQLTTNNHMRTMGKRLEQGQINLSQDLLGLTALQKEISALSAWGHFFSGFNSTKGALARDFGLYRFLLTLPRFVVEAGLLIGVLGLALWLQYQGSANESLPTLAIFLVGGFRLIGAMLPIQNALADIKTHKDQASIALKYLEDQLPSPRPVLFKKNQAHQVFTQEDGEIRVEVQKLGFSFDNSSQPVLYDVSFSASSGQLTAIAGRSGSGKSTLLNLILGNLSPTSGGIQLNNLPPKEYRSQFPHSLAFLPQRPGVIAGSIASNVAIGVPTDAIDYGRVEELLSGVDLLDTLSERGISLDQKQNSLNEILSGGQLLRLGLARALYSRPKLVLLDEPTSSLDPLTDKVIHNTIIDVAKTAAVVLVAHKLSTLKIADSIAYLDRGRLVEFGPPGYVMNNSTLLNDYVDGPDD